MHKRKTHIYLPSVGIIAERVRATSDCKYCGSLKGYVHKEECNTEPCPMCRTFIMKGTMYNRGMEIEYGTFDELRKVGRKVIITLGDE